MDSYRVLQEFKNSEEDVGKPMAIHFDYGTIHHDKYGDAHLSGNLLCFGTYQLPKKMETETDELKPLIEDIRSSYLKEFSESGLEEGELEKMVYLKKKTFSCNVGKFWCLLNPGVIVEGTMAMVLNACVLFAVDDAIEKIEENGGDWKSFMEVHKLVLQGKSTHLNQLEVPGWMRASLGFLILFRSKFLNTSAPEGWTHCAEAFLGYWWAASKEKHILDWSMQQYLNLRSFTCGGLTGFDMNLAVNGVHVSEDIRSDPDFNNIRSLISLYLGLVNDICSLQKELGRGEITNIIILLAQNMPLQVAIQEALKIVEDTYFQIRAIGRSLARSFPFDKCIEHIMNVTTRMAEVLLLYQESLPERFQLVQGSKFYEIEFGAEFLKKESEIQALNRISGQDCQESTLMAAILKFKTEHEESNCSKESCGPFKTVGFTRGQHLSIPDCSNNYEKCTINHLAIIPDGNRRWARNSGLNIWIGHRTGFERLLETVRNIFDRGVHTVTIWCLSSDNFKRSGQELKNLFVVFLEVIQKFRPDLDELNARVCHIGNKGRLPLELQELLLKYEHETKDRTQKCFNVALDYGGREEILRAFSKPAFDGTPASMESISRNLWTDNRPYPEPDLIVRTGGKDSKTVRTSGFMIWQSEYSEFYFEDKYMPEIGPPDIERWMDAYNNSERRFGK